MIKRLAVFVVALLVAACSGQKPDSSVLPSTLVVAPGAREVRVETKDDGSIGVSYYVREEYPAEPFLSTVRMALPTSEWRPLPNDWLNPGMRSSHDTGWSQSTDMSEPPPKEVHAWTAQWQDAAGNVVNYMLRYETKLSGGPRFVSKPETSSLQVTAMWVPAKVAEQMIAAAAAGRPPRRP